MTPCVLNNILLLFTKQKYANACFIALCFFFSSFLFSAETETQGLTFAQYSTTGMHPQYCFQFCLYLKSTTEKKSQKSLLKYKRK
jgi:hypothetical protein